MMLPILRGGLEHVAVGNADKHGPRVLTGRGLRSVKLVVSDNRIELKAAAMRRLHEGFDPVRESLPGLAQLLAGPVGGVAQGEAPEPR